MTEIKRRILRLIERYGSARVNEELAGHQDAPMSVVQRHYDAGKQAWQAIGAELDALAELSSSCEALRAKWPEGGCIVTPPCGACVWCRFAASLDALHKIGADHE